MERLRKVYIVKSCLTEGIVVKDYPVQEEIWKGRKVSLVKPNTWSLPLIEGKDFFFDRKEAEACMESRVKRRIGKLEEHGS